MVGFKTVARGLELSSASKDMLQIMEHPTSNLAQIDLQKKRAFQNMELPAGGQVVTCLPARHTRSPFSTNRGIQPKYLKGGEYSEPAEKIRPKQPFQRIYFFKVPEPSSDL